MRLAGAVIALLAAATTLSLGARLQRKADPLSLIDGADREGWQQPDRIMDELGIADGAHVGDLMAGSGWFTARLARRVGPNGLVYATDTDPQMVAALTREVREDDLGNVRV